LASWADFITTTPELEFSVHTGKKLKKLIRADAADAKLLDFYRDMGISNKAGRMLIAPDSDHLFWLNADLAKTLDIKTVIVDAIDFKRVKTITVEDHGQVKDCLGTLAAVAECWNSLDKK
jgi:hypothetical protein